ncbi:Trp biosynthesis-associated membrane protein [Nakamurella sp. A5-74]|uniref:Trp biosynthesis-associated membrane protein n=1 Tax=Nakamurella sp. A5-74 TaxID=3158264 RepID=A0AAU8DWD3_9ACTN
MRRIRGLLLPLGVLLVAAGALVRWWSVTWTRPLLGEQRDTVTGSAAAPALMVFALAAIAGWAAAAGTRSTVVRRVIGGSICVIGVAIGWVAVATAADGPQSVILARHPEAAGVQAAGLIGWGPALAVFGGVLLVAAGVVILLRRGAGGMGARFERPGASAGSGSAAPTATGSDAADRPRQSHPEDDAALLWKGLDAGRDPTGPDGPERATR